MLPRYNFKQLKAMESAAKQTVYRMKQVGRRPQCKSRTPVPRDHGKAPWAGFEAGVEGLKAWKLEQNNMTKKAGFFLVLKT